MMPSVESAYLFRHALVREAAYQLQMPAARARLHGMALDAIEHLFGTAGNSGALDHFAEELAEHAKFAQQEAAGGDAGLSAAAREALAAKEACYLLQAAESAAAGFQTLRAARLFTQVAYHPHIPAPQRVAGATRGMQLLRMSARPAQALALAEGVREEAERLGDPLVLGSLLLEQGSLLEDAGRSGEAEVLFSRAHELLLKGNNRPRAAAALARLATLRQRTGKEAESAELYARAWQEVQGGAKPELVAVGVSHAWDLFHAGRHPEAYAVIEDFTAGLDELTPPQRCQVLNARAVFDVQSGKLERAENTYRQVIEIASKIGLVAVEAAVESNLGNLHFYYTGRLDEAQRHCRNSLIKCVECGDVMLECTNRERLAAFHRMAGDLAAARTELELAFNHARAADLVTTQVTLLRNLGTVMDSLGQGKAGIVAARQALQLCLDHSITRPLMVTQGILARLLGKHGRINAATLLQEQALASTAKGEDAEDHPIISGDHALVLALLGKLDEAARYTAKAQSQMNEKETPQHYIHSGLWPRFVVEVAGATGTWPRGDLPRPESLEMARATLARMRSISMPHQIKSYPGVRSSLEQAAAILEAIDRASAAKTTPLVFNGRLPAQMPPALRLALLARLQALHPSEYASLQTEHAALYAAMGKGTEGLPVPDWRAESI